MLTLAIDTASGTTSIALLDGAKVLSEESWVSTQNEAETLMPRIMKMVPEIHDVKKIIAVSGPGSFTGLRVGVTVANTLAYLTGAELYAVGTFEIWKARCAEKNAVLLIKAGKKEVFMDEKLCALDDVDAEKVFGDLLPDQKSELEKRGIKFVKDSEIKSFGSACASLGKLEKADIIKPNYCRSPQITISKDKWKKQKSQK